MPRATEILDLSLDQLRRLVEDMGEQPYRAHQILAWIFRKGVTSVEHMTDLPQSLRETLAARCKLGPATVEHVARSRDDSTAKYLFRLPDAEAVEAVSMSDRSRRTFCLSSQVGCAMNCAFCATGSIGFKRNLTTGEILIQPVEISRREGRPTNIVFMGMGEPLLNLDNVLKSLEALTDPHRLALAARRITVSTCGIPDGILGLARARVPVNLALSLNSPFQDQRAELMPVAREYTLDTVLAACAQYAKTTGRRVNLEYVLLHDVNTGRGAAAELARIASTLDAKINLIAYNPAPGSPFTPPTTPETLRFRKWLQDRGLRVTIRFRKGREIAAGCGQLAGKAPPDKAAAVRLADEEHEPRE